VAKIHFLAPPKVFIENPQDGDPLAQGVQLPADGYTRPRASSSVSGVANGQIQLQSGQVQSSSVLGTGGAVNPADGHWNLNFQIPNNAVGQWTVSVTRNDGSGAGDGIGLQGPMPRVAPKKPARKPQTRKKEQGKRKK
jgi:hypothetical protein